MGVTSPSTAHREPALRSLCTFRVSSGARRDATRARALARNASRIRRAVKPPSHHPDSRSTSPVVVIGQRQPDEEARADAYFALDAELPAVLVDDDSPGDGQAEPGAPADGLRGEERVED